MRSHSSANVTPLSSFLTARKGGKACEQTEEEGNEGRHKITNDTCWPSTNLARIQSAYPFVRISKREGLKRASKLPLFRRFTAHHYSLSQREQMLLLIKAITSHLYMKIQQMKSIGIRVELCWNMQLQVEVSSKNVNVWLWVI